ncbi:MAG TPA: hypothetical protein VMV76_04870 [Dehalococcoidia bacterium]|nr:hypothetical protein [Dehalococcoidia bacterium]
MTEKEAKELAEQHWKFLERWLRIVYVDAMVHGIKHGMKTSQPKQHADLIQKGD